MKEFDRYGKQAIKFWSWKYRGFFKCGWYYDVAAEAKLALFIAKNKIRPHYDRETTNLKSLAFQIVGQTFRRFISAGTRLIAAPERLWYKSNQNKPEYADAQRDAKTTENINVVPLETVRLTVNDDPLEKVIRTESLDAIFGILEQETPRVQSVIRSRFFEHKTLEEISGQIGVTRQRTLQIIEEFLDKTREALGVVKDADNFKYWAKAS
jgi:RNA polymerase sigma factor (sigma-70 family)